MAELPAAIGEVVRELREAQGMSVRELSRRGGVSTEHVRLLETRPGKLGPCVTTFAAIARALGLRPSELLALAEERAREAARNAA